jgi:hypothetical protein
MELCEQKFPIALTVGEASVECHPHSLKILVKQMCPKALNNVQYSTTLLNKHFKVQYITMKTT